MTRRVSPTGAATIYGEIQKAAGRIPPLPPNYKDSPIPCGRCWGCKLERSRQTAVRLMHEAQQHKLTSFITLTYNNKHLPIHPSASSQSLTALGELVPELPREIDRHAHAKAHAHRIQNAATLVPRDLQLFTKRLNEDVRRRSGKGIKYYACGEYGDKKHRPHYHIAVFGEDFSDDRLFWKTAKSGHPLWRSSRLTRLWNMGDADIGDLTFESAAYIARYIMKKITGTKAADHYTRTTDDGNKFQIEPEFNRMSRGGRTGRGLAYGWFDKYNTSVYPHDRVISRGHPAKPPRYYDELMKALRPLEIEAVKLHRAERAQKQAGDNTPARLEARETVALAKLMQNKRSLE